MALTPEQFEQLTRFLGPPPAPSVPSEPAYAGPERRETPRKPVRGPAELRPLEPAKSAGGLPRAVARGRGFTVYVHDVSLGGAGLLSGTPVLPASAVDLVLSNGHDDLTVRCSVRHCTALAAGLYGLGVDVVAFHVREAEPESTGEAAAAWSEFFKAQPGTSSQRLVG